MVLSLHTLPVEMVYRILDNLDDEALFLSVQNVCQRLNKIINTYHRYLVNFDYLYVSKKLVISTILTSL